MIQDAAGPVVFRVRVVDGRNGAAMPNARISLWYDETDGPGYAITAGPDGTAPMPQPVGVPVRLFASPIEDYDCRKLSADAQPPAYNLDAVAKSGLAANNRCGAVHVRAKPGELVIYARPARWFEKINRNATQQ